MRLNLLRLALAEDPDLLGLGRGERLDLAASWRERSYSALPWFDWMLIDSSDSVMSVCCLARASASRSSRSFIAAFSCRV